MILTGSKIEEEVGLGNIVLSPFEKDLINPNSYNYRLGDSLLEILDSPVDAKKAYKTKKIVIPKEGYKLNPGNVYLGVTYEKIGSKKYVPSLIGRSSLGRLGLFLQITADLGHLGTNHHWTLELKSVQPLIVYPHMRIGQVSFWKTDGLELITHDYKEQINNYSEFSEPQPTIISKFD